MKKPTYKHPDFVISTSDQRIESKNKRLWLSLTIDNNSSESLIVILKNPSRATKDISDKTVFNVTNYVYKNRNRISTLKNIGKIIIVNLIPYYETYSELLSNSNFNIIDKENLKIINDLTKKHNKVIIAWGNHPKNLYEEYEFLKVEISNYLKTNENQIFYVDKLSKIGNPKHGQVWGYSNELIQLTQ